MRITSYSDLGKMSLENKFEVLIGLSIKNSYFKTMNLRKIISWCNENFDHIDIMIPDKPSVHDLKAFGYEEVLARRKANLEANRLENKCKKIIHGLDILKKTKIIRWKNIENNAEYKKSYNSLSNLYKNNKEFRKDVRNLSKDVVVRNGTKLDLEKAVDIAIEFVLEEFSFVINAANILGIKAAVYLYHRHNPMHEKLLNGAYGYKTPENTGYIIAEV